jgi:predicted RecA/RadA family phage recombinase
MAKATFIDGLANLRTLKLAHTAAVEAYDVIVSAGSVLVAVNDADANVENTYVYAGRVMFPKAAEAIAAAVKGYWDATAGNITATATANTAAGILLEAAASADNAVVALRPN